MSPEDVTFKDDKNKDETQVNTSLNNLIESFSPPKKSLKLEGDLTKISQSNESFEGLPKRAVSYSEQIKMELDKIEKIMLLEKKWSGQYVLTNSLKQLNSPDLLKQFNSPKATSKKFGLLAKQDEDHIKLTKEDTELLLGALLDLMISPK